MEKNRLRGKKIIHLLLSARYNDRAANLPGCNTNRAPVDSLGFAESQAERGQNFSNISVEFHASVEDTNGIDSRIAF